MPQRIEGNGRSRPAAPDRRSTSRATSPAPSAHDADWDDAARVRGEARRTRWRVGAALAALLVVGVGLSVLLATPPPRAPAGATAAKATASSPTRPQGSASAAAPFTAPARWIDLPQASGASAQMPTGFPHTAAGAAAFAVQVVQFSWSASYDQVQRAAALYAAGPSGPAQQDAVAFAAQLRALAGIPAAGLPPAGSGLSARVVGLAVRGDDTGTQVDLLVEVTAASGPGQSQTLAAATTVLAVWDTAAGDWRYRAASQPCARAADDLGTAGFNAAGWSAVQAAAP